MKKVTAAVAVAAALLSGQAFAEPTRGFTLESAKTAHDKSFSVDLVNTMNGINQIRVGAFAGEVIVNPTGVGAGSLFGGTHAGRNPSFGYKRTINDMFAAFGMLGLNTQDGAKNEFLIGGAFSGKADQLLINANATLGAENDDTVFAVGAGIYIPLEVSGSLSHFQLGGELYVGNRKNSNVGFAFGGRWAPRDNVTVDVLLLEDPESKAVDAFLATPASVRVNFAF